MKIVKLIALFFLCSLVFNAKANPASFDIPVKIFQSIEKGDVEGLNKYLNASVELIIMDQESIYSKQQANQVLKDFFNKNRPSKFTVLHQGGSEKAKYAIGKLETKNGTFRVHFHVKMNGGKPLIHQFRIQSE